MYYNTTITAMKSASDAQDIKYQRLRQAIGDLTCVYHTKWAILRNGHHDHCNRLGTIKKCCIIFPKPTSCEILPPGKRVVQSMSCPTAEQTEE